MYDARNTPPRTQFSHYLRTGRILPTENFGNQKSDQSGHDEDDFLSFKSWTTLDFVERYISGSGQTVDLENVGLLNRFRNTHSVRNAIREFEMRQMRIAEQQANKSCGQSQNTVMFRTFFSDKDSTVTDVTGDGPLYSVGRSSFFQSSQCSVAVNCSKKIVQLEGIMTFEIKDWFKDPLDIDIELPRAKIYKIVAKWSQPINFIYDRLRTGRWVQN